MAEQKKFLRGLRDIRTLSARVDAAAAPYMGYMKIASLEMERARRLREKNSALNLVHNIDARFQDMDAEKDRLLHALGDRVADGRPLRRSAPSARHADVGAPRGVKIKY
jgi:hypothetical protein